MTSNSQPLFSVVTPTFNAVSKVEATAESVFGQTKGLWEYLVVDGCSTDGTIELLHSLASVHATNDFRVHAEPDLGIYDAMNKGIRLATGRFLLFLGAGDRLRPDILMNLAADLGPQESDCEQQPRLIYGDVWWESQARVHDGVFTPRQLCHGNICQQAILYERTLFERLGVFNLRYPWCADHAFNIRAFGDSGVLKVRVERIFADYEGVGGSTEMVDRAFRRDWFGLVRENFGLYYAVRHLLLPRTPWWLWLRGRLRPQRRLSR